LFFSRFISESSLLQVTVFDFSTILERTERRVRDDLLGAGPKTVEELRSIAARLRVKYHQQLEHKIRRAKQQEENSSEGMTISSPVKIAPPPQMKGVMDKATNIAGDFFAKVKIGKIPNCFNGSGVEPSPTNSAPETAATIVDLPPLNDTPMPTESVAASAVVCAPPKAPSTAGSDGDWTGQDLKPATDAISNFSIGDEDEDDPDLLL
jgi:hypothetical protein